MYTVNIEVRSRYHYSCGKAISTGHTQKNVAVYYVFSMETAPFFCVCPVLHTLIVGLQP
jgi:hypothetical protein